LRPIGDCDGQTLSFFAQSEQGALAQASDGLEHRFGPRAGAPDCLKVASIRHVQLPALIDDQRVGLTVLARETIRAADARNVGETRNYTFRNLTQKTAAISDISFPCEHRLVQNSTLVSPRDRSEPASCRLLRIGWRRCSLQDRSRPAVPVDF